MKVETWLNTLGIEAHDLQLYEIACTHSSYVNENHSSRRDNERMEFMGDAVLELWVSERLYQAEPSLAEGQMTTIRAQLVCEAALASYSRKLGLNQFIKLGHGEERSGGRERDSIIADMFEAFLGAIYLDGGMVNADCFLNSVMADQLTNLDQFMITDYKTKLQEYVQGDLRKTVSYEIEAQSGPANAPEFIVVVKLDELVMGRGKGSSKKKAEQAAARDAFSKLVV